MGQGAELWGSGGNGWRHLQALLPLTAWSGFASPTPLASPPTQSAPLPAVCPASCRYEKARKLKQYIGGIRETYTRNWDSRDRAERQVGAGKSSRRGGFLCGPAALPISCCGVGWGGYASFGGSLWKCAHQRSVNPPPVKPPPVKPCPPTACTADGHRAVLH